MQILYDNTVKRSNEIRILRFVFDYHQINDMVKHSDTNTAVVATAAAAAAVQFSL